MSDTTYNVYRNGEKIASNLTEKTYTDTGLDPDTEYDYQVSSENKFGESDLSNKLTVKTNKINVTGVTLSPKTSTGESGTAGEQQVTATVAPSNATDKTITYTISPVTDGLSVTDSGLIKWTDTVGAGKYTTTVTTSDGGFTDTHVLTLSEPEPEVTIETETENIDLVEYETVRNETNDLPKGEEEVVQEGKDGYTKVTYEVTYEDGIEVNRKEIDREVIDPVDEIINVGTFEEPEPNPEEPEE